MGYGERVALALLAAALLLPWILSGGSTAEVTGVGQGTAVDARGIEAQASPEGVGGGEAWERSAFSTFGSLAEELRRRVEAGLSPDMDAALRAFAEQAALGGAAARLGAGSGAGSGSAGGAGSRRDVAAIDFSIRNRDPDFANLPIEDFDPRDLAVLEEIIALNGLDESSSDFDFDNGDGEMDPRELGDQRWCNGRLRELRLGPDFFSGFGYEVKRLPPSIADLDGLLVLEANEVGLQQLPDTVGQLPNLRRLSLYNNQVASLPERLGEAPRLEEIQATGNPIRDVPEAVAQGASLERLFVDMDGLNRMPAMLEQQREALANGSLRVPSRDLGPLGASCLPSS